VFLRSVQLHLRGDLRRRRPLPVPADSAASEAGQGQRRGGHPTDQRSDQVLQRPRRRESESRGTIWGAQ